MRPFPRSRGLLQRWLCLAAICVWGWTFPQPSDAAQVTYQEGPCPLGDDTVRIFVKVSDNLVGGWDADTATYSANGQWRSHKVATCANSLFSLFGEDMRTFQPDPDLRARVERALANAKRELSNPDEPQVWERYRIAARMYAEMGRTPLFMAELWLEASWTVRDNGVGYYEGLAGPKITRDLLNAGNAELAKELSVAQRRSVLFNLARVAHRGGYPAERDRLIAEYKSTGALAEREAAAILRLEEAARIEPMYQREALRFFLEAAQQQRLTDEEAARVAYLVGELSRRLGDTATARTYLQKALASGHLDERTGDMAQVLLAEIGQK